MSLYGPPPAVSVGEGLYLIFSHYVAPWKSKDATVGQVEYPSMDGAAFTRMCKEAPELTRYIGRTDIDLIFSKSKPHGMRRLDYGRLGSSFAHAVTFLLDPSRPLSPFSTFFILLSLLNPLFSQSLTFYLFTSSNPLLVDSLTPSLDHFLDSLLELATRIFPDDDPSIALANFLAKFIFALFDQPPTGGDVAIIEQILSELSQS